MISAEHRRLLQSPAISAPEPPAAAADCPAGSVVSDTSTAPQRGISILLDCETLATGPGSIITSFAAIAFDRETMEMRDFILLDLDLYDQLAAGREFNADTIAFHRRNRTLPLAATGHRTFIAAGKIQEFFLAWQPKRIWIQGTDFDRPLIENFFASFGQPLPWDFSKSRDARTACDLAFPGVKHPPRPHQSLADCQATLADLKSALDHLGARASA